MRDEYIQSESKTRILLALIGFAIIFLVIVFGGLKSDILYYFLLSISFFMILLAILWHYKQRITGIIITILFLLLIFFVMGFIFGFRLGIVTMIFIMAYAFWIDAEKLKNEWWKFTIFIILIYVFYISGILPSLNTSADILFGFAKSL